MKKDRVINDLDSYLGNFSQEVENKSNRNGKIKILDAGCGYGLVMAGLIKKFGDRIELVGYNKSKEDGTLNDFKEKVIKFKIFTEKDIKKIKPPKIIYLDANKKLPFKSEEFDLIYSLASVYLYKEKIKFFEECNRILKKDGIARIHLFELKTDRAIIDDLRKINNPLISILNNDNKINFVDYFDKLPGLEIKLGKREDNRHAIVFLEIKKQPMLIFNLRLIRAVKNEGRGFNSIYEVIGKK